MFSTLSYGELDLLFQNNVPAWRFHKTKADRELHLVWYPESMREPTFDTDLSLEFDLGHELSVNPNTTDTKADVYKVEGAEKE